MENGPMEFRVFDRLPQEARDIRTEVFVEEQGFEVEFDDVDGMSSHIVGYIDGEPVAVCRIYPVDGAYAIGRIAVRSRFRGRSLGSAVVRRAEEEIRRRGCSRAVLSAQTRVRPFYESLGYSAEGDEYMDEFCPHIRMTRNL